MHKKILVYSVITLFIAFFLSFVYGASRGANVGIVNSLTGIANCYHNDKSEPESLEVGSKIFVHDRVVTDKESVVQIIFRDDSAVTLGAESELVIDADSFNIITGERKSILSLLQGKVRSVVGDKFSSRGSRFEVHTHTAVAGVRGTENLVVTEKQPPTTTVYGIESTTYVRNADKKVKGELSIGPKKGAKVLAGQTPQPFDFQFDDPAFRELINSTSAPDGADAEDDISMGSMERNIPDMALTERDTGFGTGHDVPSFDQEVDEQRPDVIPPVELDDHELDCH